MPDLEQLVRLRAFEFLSEQTAWHGEVLPHTVLVAGFQFEGHRVPLIGPQGIFKPAILELPISITTAPVVEGKQRPYDDAVDADGRLLYRYRGTDPGHRDNVGLRLAIEGHVPLVYLVGIVPGRYLPVWPAFIVGDQPEELTFKVEVEANASTLGLHGGGFPIAAEPQRGYASVITLHRVHQAAFRERVLRAYQEQCAICHLKHAELLEAAHILPDGHPKGLPEVPNGLALCKLHHAAFDRNIIGIRPDLVIEVRNDVLVEEDGPMLRYGLQGFHRQRLIEPRAPAHRANPDFLAERYDVFKKAG